LYIYHGGGGGQEYGDGRRNALIQVQLGYFDVLVDYFASVIYITVCTIFCNASFMHIRQINLQYLWLFLSYLNFF